MKKRLMILGSLKEFTQLVQLAKDRGICTVVCDGYPDGPAKQIADYAYDIDVRETVSLSRYAKQHDVDAVSYTHLSGCTSMERNLYISNSLLCSPTRTCL